MEKEEVLRSELVRVSRALHERGWVANHDGNLSARLGAERLLATPTAVSKGAVSNEMLIIVDGEGKKVAGTRKPFSEIALHLVAYRSRSDVGAVLHAHPPSATAFAAAGLPLPPPFMAEAVVSIGPEIPLLPFGLPGDPALESALNEGLGRSDVFLLGNHGVLTVGPDPDLCLLRMELVEHLAKIALQALPLGGVRPLPQEVVAKLAATHQELFPRQVGGSAHWGATATYAWSPPTPSARPAREIVDEALKKFR